jgi:hypothetical protein
MADTIAALMGGLEADAFRSQTRFSPEMQAALDRVLSSKSDNDITTTLNSWISKYQPCLFGRIAAKQDAITYCLIPEEMLYGDETDLKRHIQSARLKWTSAGFHGKSSNFVIAVLSRKLALAAPSEYVKKIALRICSLYLLEPVQPDRIHLDRLYLEKPGPSRRAWEWVAGVNYFSAQADGRWWQDHRFPAGIAFSTNSVGHMVKSGKLARALHDLDEIMGTAIGDYSTPKVDSLDKALDLAMRTINMASPSVSGRATFLIRLSDINAESRPKCPLPLPPSLAGMDYCSYCGFYHTDYTLPSEYFVPDVLRITGGEPYTLDFTYLFNRDLDNPDFDRMGEGRPITSAEGVGYADYRAAKQLMGAETEVQIADVPRLEEALGTEFQS